MTWFRVGGAGIPAALKNAMNAVFNKKFGTSGQNYPPNQWPDDVNLMGPLPEGTASGSISHIIDGADQVPIKTWKCKVGMNLDGKSAIQGSQYGKNLLDASTIQDGYQINETSGLPTAWNGRCATTTPITIHGGNITVSYNSTDSLVRLMYSFFKNGSFIERVANIASGTTIDAHDYDTMYIGFANVNGVAITKDVLSNIQIEVGSDQTQFEPYTSPNVYNVPLGRTVYGATVDLISGEGLITYNRVDLGSFNWVKVTSSQTPYFSTNSALSPSYKWVSQNANAICNNYSFASIGSSGSQEGFFIVDNSYVRIRDSNYESMSADEFKSAISGTLLTYELASPSEAFFVQSITPPETPETNVCNFWNNTGDSEVVYRRDIDLALQAVSSSRGLMMASRPVTQLVGEESDPDQVNELVEDDEEVIPEQLNEVVENDETEQEGENDAR